MAIAPAGARTETIEGLRVPRRQFAPLQREGILAYLFMIPGWAILLLFMAYPFFFGVYLSLTNRMVGFPDYSYIGLLNYRNLWNDSIFRQTIENTLSTAFLPCPLSSY